MKQKLFLVFFLSLAFFPGITAKAQAAQTSGGVNWLDPLGYQKPQFMPITYPSEADCGSSVYYVNLSGGSGTACSSATPCSWATAVAKSPVTSGGPARIYLQGTGPITDGQIIGGVGTEIVIKPKDDSTTATITGRNNWAAKKQNVIFDGGPNMQIIFSSTAGGTFDPAIYFNASASNPTYHQNIKFYRTRWNVPGTNGLWMAAYGPWTNLYFINCEFYAASRDHQQHMYPSNNSGGGLNGFYIWNNIFRDTGGEAIELRMSSGSSATHGLEIKGNAFHDIGKGTCGVGWGCRSAVTMAEGTIDGVTIANNLIWNTGEGCLRTWSNASNSQILGNTCYNWGSGSSASGGWSQNAFMGYSTPYTPQGTFRNNIIYATGNDPNGNAKQPWTNTPNGGATYNACETGHSCGSSGTQVVSSASFLSLDPNNTNFLKLAASSAPIDHGTDLSSYYTNSYFGDTRSGTYDIGAYEYSSGQSDTTAPGAPEGLSVR